MNEAAAPATGEGRLDEIPWDEGRRGESRSGVPAGRLALWAFLGSLLVHLLLFLAAAIWHPARRLPRPPERLVTVEIIAAPQPPPLPELPAALPAVPPSVALPDTPPVAEPESAPQPATQGMVQASRTYSARLLADPRNREAARALPQLAVDERLVQLCNIEAMEQVRLAGLGHVPEAVVAYAMADLKFGGRTLEADGGAFRSGRHWYNLKYKCSAAANYRDVVSFAYQVGEEIPESEWASHNLALDIGHLD